MELTKQIQTELKYRGEMNFFLSLVFILILVGCILLIIQIYTLLYIN